MRAAATGRTCGSAPQPACGAPVDACGPGWGVCLSHASSTLDTNTFLSHVDVTTCGVPSGAFLAAMSHAPTGSTQCPDPANHSLDNGCPAASGYGSEPLCCGAVCGVPSCSTALWPGKTRALFGTEAAGSCGGVVTNPVDGAPRGVLCCRVTPPPPTTLLETLVSAQTEASPLVDQTASSDDRGGERDLRLARRVDEHVVAVNSASNTNLHNTAMKEVISVKTEVSDDEIVDEPRATKPVPPGLVTWVGSSLSGMHQFLPQPADMTLWSGGLSGGPVVFYDASRGRLDVQLTSVVLGPSNEFTTGILSRVGNRLVGGVQGMVSAINMFQSESFDWCYLRVNFVWSLFTEV
jgi:hypothetical protein